MLVIKMQEDDMLVIGDDVRIYVRQVAGSGVKLCIDAPREVVITRLAAPREATPLEHAKPADDALVESTERVARARRSRDTTRRV